MKNYAFQYATNSGKTIKDTDLITKEEAYALWDYHYADFVERMKNNEGPEMAIWANMIDDTDYHTQEKYLHGYDCILRDGVLFELVQV